MSPGTATFVPNSSSAGEMVAVAPQEFTAAPKWRSISSVWLRESAGSVTLVSPWA